MFLCQRHSSVKTDDRELASDMKDRLDDPRVQIYVDRLAQIQSQTP